jgi:phage terminase Nu1 subunit (DNA packaging protein)
MKDKWLSQSQAAKEFGISRSKIRRLLRDGLISLNKQGKISYLRLKAALEAEEKAQETNQEVLADLNLRLKMAMAIYREEKAKMVEIERKRKEGELVPVDAVAQAWCERALTVKNQLLSWISKLPPLLERKSKQKIAQILKEQIDEVLEALYQNGEYTPRSEED